MAAADVFELRNCERALDRSYAVRSFLIAALILSIITPLNLLGLPSDDWEMQTIFFLIPYSLGLLYSYSSLRNFEEPTPRSTIAMAFCDFIFAFIVACLIGLTSLLKQEPPVQVLVVGYLGYIMMRARFSLYSLTPEQATLITVRDKNLPMKKRWLARLNIPPSTLFARRARSNIALYLICSFSIAWATALFWNATASSGQGIVHWINSAHSPSYGASVKAIYNLQMAVGAVLLCAVAIGLAKLLAEIARIRTRLSAAALLTEDKRSPILYLRAFDADRTPLIPPKLGLFGWLYAWQIPSTNLDHLVVTEATPYAPVIAIGNPKDPVQPSGAAREYIADAEWQQTVSELCDSAKAIILCLDASTGVRWEFDHIVSSGHWKKTLLLASPQAPAGAFYEMARSAPHVTSNPSAANPIGCFVRSDGTVEWLESRRPTQSAYILSLRRFLRGNLNAAVGKPFSKWNDRGTQPLRTGVLQEVSASSMAALGLLIALVTLSIHQLLTGTWQAESWGSLIEWRSWMTASSWIGAGGYALVLTLIVIRLRGYGKVLMLISAALCGVFIWHFSDAINKSLDNLPYASHLWTQERSIWIDWVGEAALNEMQLSIGFDKKGAILYAGIPFAVICGLAGVWQRLILTPLVVIAGAAYGLFFDLVDTMFARVVLWDKWPGILDTIFDLQGTVLKWNPEMLRLSITAYIATFLLAERGPSRQLLRSISWFAAVMIALHASVVLAHSTNYYMTKQPTTTEELLSLASDLLRLGRSEGAEVLFAKAQEGGARSQAIDSARAAGLLSRGEELLRSSKYHEGDLAFTQAREKGALAEDVVKAILRVADYNLEVAARDQGQASKKRDTAFLMFEKSIAWARAGEVSAELRAATLFGRGILYRTRGQNEEAVSDLREAEQLGHPEAALWLWKATTSLGRQRIDQDRLVEGLLIIWGSMFDLSPDVQKAIEPHELKLNFPLALSIGKAHATFSREGFGVLVTECDQLTSSSYDPMRVTAAIDFGKIESLRAITACDQAIRLQPDEPRFPFLRGRAHASAAGRAASAQDERGAKISYALAVDDFRSAMAKGYPMAFNNLAYAYLTGEGVEQDLDKAADLSMELLNRTLHCCWTPVARYLLVEGQKRDVALARRIVGELTRWSAALQSEPAKGLLAELTANGTLPAGTNAYPPADFTSVPPWLEQKR